MDAPDDNLEPTREPEIFSDERHRRADAKMLQQAIEKGWLKERWPTRATKGEIERTSAGRDTGRTLVELAVLETHSLLLAEDARAKATGARVAVAMERQNQVDQLHAVKSGNDPSLPESTTLTTDQTVVLMDESIPQASDQKAS